MNKIKNKFEDGKELLWKKVDPKDLKPGDHIYAYRMCGSYTHHGIYVGSGRVIHYTSTDNKNGLLSPSEVKPKTAPTCPECGYQENTGCGVIKTCLDCFRQHNGTLHSIHFFKYGAPRWGYLLKIAGTCSNLSCDKSPEEVVEVAQKSLRSNGFGTYHVIDNNCKHFATYCKTGVSASEQAAFYDGFAKKCRDAKERIKKFVE
ncbi:protein LEAD-SENSITIVE 1-like [Syzygium oleosum]|uniref:protein LEAD-SENSITIVE 1-like n=1 Tax=Syzygium oleosum TaxID=219896 RepID=UPI0011D209D8|nr:protein LEAD-SENSITIVE 1-like [Syzygium oleosum]